MIHNSTLSTDLSIALTAIIQSTIEAKTFILSELPDVVSQLLSWHFYASLITFIICLTLIIACLFGAKKTISMCYNPKEESSYDQWSTFAPLNLLWIIPIIIIPLCMNLNWLQILIAPKIYLIEYAAKLLN